MYYPKTFKEKKEAMEYTKKWLEEQKNKPEYSSPQPQISVPNLRETYFNELLDNLRNKEEDIKGCKAADFVKGQSSLSYKDLCPSRRGRGAWRRLPLLREALLSFHPDKGNFNCGPDAKEITQKLIECKNEN